MNQIFIFLLLLISDALGQLISTKKDIEVLIGREVYIKPSDLEFYSVISGEICKVEVVSNEPMSQRVGLLEPQVFDCAFKYGTVKYSHHGSPLLMNDTVKLRAYKFLKKDTLSEFLDLNIVIKNEPYNVIQLLRNLEVKEFFGFTDIINDSIVNFNFSRSEGAVCKARMSRYVSNRPAHGQIVVGWEKKPVDVIKRRCDDFLNLGLQYKHTRPLTPNIDYVVLIIEVSDPLYNNGELTSEWLHIPIEIQPGFPNFPPKASFSSMYLMDVNQFVITTITPAVLSSTDSETQPDQLIFNISKPLLVHQGSIVHLSDPTRPITSFRQVDLNNFNVAYKPPLKVFKERQMFEIGFTIFDADFASSEPFTLHIVIRPIQSNAPRISMNTGMVLLEGQSRPLRPKNLEVVSDDNISNIQIFVTGGLHHGKLEVGKRPAVSFTQLDIEAGRVIYHHDDSDTTKDSIHLRVYDGSESTHVKFPINIIPKDDSPPSLIINTGLKVEEGRSVSVSSDALRAVDHDTSDEHITYIIKKRPNVGMLKKKFSWEKAGSAVNNFTQRDVNKGLLLYQHDGSEEFADSFDMVIQDMNNPPNNSPIYKVVIHITPIGNEPPKRDLASSFSLELLETDVGVLSSKHIHYFDTDSSDREIVYTVTEQPKYVGSFALSDPGKIVTSADGTFLTKNVHTPAITNFTQEEVNFRKIAYMPPMDDIGPNALYLQCVFAISDKHGNTVTGQLLNITILPVNNQIPQLHTGYLLVEEGSSTLLSTNELSVYDPDTLRSDLQMSLFTIPLHGSLRRSGQPLRVGDLLSLDDILTLRLEYIHDGSESFKDSFKVGVNDGLHFVAGEVQIDVDPVDDETPVWLPALLDHVFVNESGILIFTSEILAATDVDTDDELLIFILTQSPRFGDIVMDNRKITRFTQRDVLDGDVNYIHNGQEIGMIPREDGVTFIVTDQAFPRLTSHISHKVRITILALDNQAPKISFKKTIFVSEGQKTAVTEDNISVSDKDTSPSGISIVISKQPEFGYLENMRPMPEYESNNRGKKIDSFLMEDIKKGFILYVQSVHRGIEPESDSFEVYATDGAQNSTIVLALVSIILQNDEEPDFTMSNITVEEGGSFNLDTTVISATDRDFPSDILVLSVKSIPKHGTLSHMVQVIDNGPVLEIPFKELAMENFNNIVYRHDGTENFNDSFKLVLSDGVHRVSRTCHVLITSINDEPPVVWRNIVSKQQESVVLSNELLQAKDPDSPNEELVFRVLSSVKCGVLQRKWNSTNGEGYWSLLDPEEFSQLDIDSNLIRYKYTSALSFCHEDGFTFLVTDGLHESAPAVFMIELTAYGKPNQTVVVNSAFVERGNDLTLNTSIIQLANDNSSPEDVTFHIITPPLHGIITLLSNDTIPVQNFTPFELVNQQVIYRQANGMNNSSDSVEMVMVNKLIQRNVSFVINFIIRDLSYELLNLETLVPLALEEGDLNSSIITSKHLLVVDPFSSEDEIWYTVVVPPQHGNLFYDNGEIVTSFSQEDVNQNLISYKSNQSVAVDSDLFLFTIRSGTHNTYLVKGKYGNSPTQFDISIKPWTKDPIVHVVPPSQIQTVWNGHLGFELSSETLKAFYPGVTTTNIRFYVVKSMQNGYIFHASDEKVVRMFTQEEVDRHNIVIILKQGSETGDFFTFHVAVGQVTYKKEYRMELHWASISFPYTEYSICEDSGILNITIQRVGKLDVSSFVTVSSVGLTAKEGLDFIPGSKRKIHFEPGVSFANWQVKIVLDEIEEAPIKQVQVVLFRPENAVIGLHNQTLINIYDFNRGSCAYLPFKIDVPVINGNLEKSGSMDRHGGGGAIEDADENSSPVSNMICDQHISGLLQFNHSMGILFSCNGHEWVPWNPDSSKIQNGNGNELQHPLTFLDSKPLEEADDELDEKDSLNLKALNNAVPRLPKQKLSSCPEAWQPFGKECFRFHRQQSTWSTALKLCQSDNNSYLATIKSSDHNDWLIHLAHNKPFWIGLHALPRTNAWNYDSISRGVPYTNWKKGFPRLPSNGETIKHRCVLVRGSGYWINRHCEYHEHSFICALPLSRKT